MLEEETYSLSGISQSLSVFASKVLSLLTQQLVYDSQDMLRYDEVAAVNFPKADASQHAVAIRIGYIASPGIASALGRCFLSLFPHGNLQFTVFFGLIEEVGEGKKEIFFAIQFLTFLTNTSFWVFLQSLCCLE